MDLTVNRSFCQERRRYDETTLLRYKSRLQRPAKDSLLDKLRS